MNVRSLWVPLVLLAATAAAAPGEPPAASGSDPVEAGLVQARARHAPVVIDFHAPWCYSCYYMARNVLNGPEWERAQRDTVVVELDADSPEGARWMQAWSVKAMPTYLVFNAQGQELGRILGEQTRGDFYQWLSATAGRANPLEALKAAVVDGKEESVNAAREVLRAYHARYDANGGLNWFLSQPPPVRAGLARDPQASSWIARLELQRAAAENDVAGCLNVAGMALAGNLGCERPYELGKVLGCSANQPEAQRRELLKPQAELMQLLLDKRVFADFRCADERSIVTTAADLYQALGDASSESLALERATADLRNRIGGDLKKDRNLSDNLRVYLERAGRTEELDALLVQLIAAWPDDYVYAYRYAKSLAGRGKHSEALPFFEQAATKAYGVNRLRNAELHAKSLQALSRPEGARQVIGAALRSNGPWFPEEVARLKALLDALPPPAPAPPAAS